MPFQSQFNRRAAVKAPSANSASQRRMNPTVVHEDMRGLDMTSPYDAIKQNRSPYARNFRLYAEESGDRRVSISNRKGSGRYLDAVGESINVQDSSTTASTDILFNKTTWLAMKFTPATTGPLTRVDLRLKANGASGPVHVRIYSNTAGAPGTKLASSGILNSAISSSPAFVQCNFVEAPSVTSGTIYWIVVFQQDDGTGNYSWRNNTDSSNALTSINSGLAWTSLGSSLAYKAYTSTVGTIIGMTRYAPETAANSTLFAFGTSMYKGNDATGASSTIATGLSASATDYFFAEMDGKKFWVNAFDDLKWYDNSTIGTITHVNLPKLRLVVAHKNRIWGIDVNNPNRLVFSEAPGNDDGAGHLWYNAWLSTSFIYVPSPKAQDPITAIIPFQDNLYIFTRTGKWVLYGSDAGSFSLRKSTGAKGALWQNGVYADENYIYFAAQDGIYRHNGSSDELLTDMVTPLYASIPNKALICVTKWKRQIKFYFPSSGSAFNDSCLIWHTVFSEWLYDTETYVGRCVTFLDGDDPDSLIEASSTAPQVTYAEVDYNNYGKAIDFEYDTKYDSLGNPAMRKRVNKFFPLIEGDNGNYSINVGTDKDRENLPSYSKFAITTSSALIGHFNIGDGTTLGNPTQFKPKRVVTSGYAYMWQVRYASKAINNRVRIVGYVMSIRIKRM